MEKENHKYSVHEIPVGVRNQISLDGFSPLFWRVRPFVQRFIRSRIHVQRMIYPLVVGGAGDIVIDWPLEP